MNEQEAWAVTKVAADDPKLVVAANAEREALWQRLGFKFGPIKMPEFMPGTAAEVRPVDEMLARFNKKNRKRERELRESQIDGYVSMSLW